MATFIVLSKVTDEGAKNLRNLRQTVEGNIARGERLGIKVRDWFLTQGHYDVVVVVEAPDAETVLAQTVGVAGSGFVRTETLRAYRLEEAEQAMQKLSGVQ